VWFQNKRSRCRKRLAKEQHHQGRLDNSDSESISSSSRLSLPMTIKDENTPEFGSFVPHRRRSKQQRSSVQITTPTQRKSTENSLTSTPSLLNLPSTLYPQLNQYSPFSQSSILASQLQLLTNQVLLQQLY
ncbi:unnamed protein product, partial [Didymodactylos carnosus]